MEQAEIIDTFGTYQEDPPRRPPGVARDGAAPAERLGPPWLPSGPTSGSGLLQVRGFSVNFPEIF